MITTIKSKEKKARKEHECMYCGGKINKNEIYDWQKLCQDGEFYEWKSHLKCSDIADGLEFHEKVDEGLTSDHFCEFINDFMNEFFPNHELINGKNWYKNIEQKVDFLLPRINKYGGVL